MSKSPDIQRMRRTQTLKLRKLSTESTPKSPQNNEDEKQSTNF